MIDSYTSFRSYFEAGEDMTLEEYGLYRLTLDRFAFLDEEPDYSSLPPLVKAALRTAIESIRKNKADRENGSKGGASKGNQNARKKTTSTTIEEVCEVDSEKQPDCNTDCDIKNNPQNNPPCFEKTSKENKNEKENKNKNENSLSQENPAKDAPPPRSPLTERAPKNDVEQVEKAYLLNYEKLKKRGLVKTEKPIINWGQSRKLTRSVIDNYGLESILLAIERSIDNDFCIEKGYSLSTILSSGVLSGLINGGGIGRSKNPLHDFENPEDIMDDVVF